MQLKIYRIYELHEYSFLAVFKTEHSYDGETSDLKIFVCQDDLLCRAPENCIPRQRVGRYVPCGSLPDPISVMPPLPEYEVVPEFTIYPNRVLETIASVTDMEVYDDDPNTTDQGFYRADTVAMIFTTEELMNRTINYVVQDFKLHNKIMNNKTADTALLTYNHFTDDSIRDYFFQG